MPITKIHKTGVTILFYLVTLLFAANSLAAPRPVFKSPFIIPLSKSSDKVIVNNNPFAVGACIALKREQMKRGVGTKELRVSYFTHYYPRFTKVVKQFFSAKKHCGRPGPCFGKYITLNDFKVLRGYTKTSRMLKTKNLTPFKLKIHTLAACGKLARASNPSDTVSTKKLFRKIAHQSTSTVNQPRNFLLGLCYVHGSTTPRISACSQAAARSQGSRITVYQVFGQSSVNINLVFSNQFREYMRRRSSRSVQDRKFVLPVTYKVISDSVVIASMTNKKGCTSVNRYSKVGSAVYQESLNQYGTCGASQRAAYMRNKRSGRRRIHVIR